ncbi:universal stress protein UspE [Chryseobacterium taihuense]|uniref:Nucleotide-binding universal stress protein, UspA family n=2 Tax=Chryseobacterium group TaxID=2782232 RepID=A0A1G9R3R9_9FLAO|nr:Nucleotide-binding universal stress protein, UspA family [Chryseobacterium taihuense]VFB03386.1 universal stress protein UspE [Chryseobacterium taihuense]
MAVFLLSLKEQNYKSKIMINIVLPVDFGDKTDQLIDGAVKFAKEVNGKICLIHVAPTDIGFAIGDMGYQYFPEIEENEIREELVLLNKLNQRILAQNVDCEHILKQGIAKDIILEYADMKNAHYIVMGSHGRSGIYDVFVGSLTKGLTKSSKIPVLVLPIHD